MNPQGQKGLPEAQMLIKHVQSKEPEKGGKSKCWRIRLRGQQQ